MAEQLPLLFHLYRQVEAGKTNVINLWDCAPKYFGYNSVRDQTQVLNRTFTLNNVTYNVEITPAVFERNGKTVHKLPGEREEFVESAIRRIAEQEEYSKWHEGFDTVQVFFTIAMLKRMLASHGHSYNHTEIQEALLILRRAGVTIRQSEGSGGMKNLCQVENYINQFNSADDSRDRYVSVTLHPLVGRGIMLMDYRSLDESTYFGIKNQLARFMYRRMCALWAGAGPDSPYTPKLKSFLEQSPRGLSKEMKQNTRAMRDALKSLQDSDVVDHWEEIPEKNGRFLLNIEFQIYPTESFVKHWKQSHARRKRENSAVGKERIGSLRKSLKD